MTHTQLSLFSMVFSDLVRWFEPGALRVSSVSHELTNGLLFLIVFSVSLLAAVAVLFRIGARREAHAFLPVPSG